MPPRWRDTPDGRAFDVVSAPVGTANAEFQDVAKKVAGGDTLEAFLRDMRTRYPDSSAISRAPRRPAADGTPAPQRPAPAAAAPAPRPRRRRTSRRSAGAAESRPHADRVD